MGAAPALRLQIVCKGNTFEKKDNRHKINMCYQILSKTRSIKPSILPL